ncbi:neutral zinc metallopeptidase [Haloechinothrix salitolerans]|uniref:Neutral zinc metallopeptidase n=1 Tax=Haloechinothrix salitolerans TaxID=926830 RepID=A0ABW2C433_9PSEU
MFPARSAIAAVAAALTLATITGCEQATEGQAIPLDVTKVGGFDVTHFESGLKPDAPAPDVTVENASSDEVDTLATATIADLNDYWGETLPADFGMEFEPVSRLISYDSSTDAIPTPCGTLNQPNAFFCERGDIVAWDRGVLLRGMMAKFGRLAPVTVMAHEYGHAVQHRLGDKAGITAGTTSIVKELQADCFTGSYLRWVVADNSAYLRVSTAEGLNASLSSLYFVRDAPGMLHGEQGAHGTSFDRAYAFQEGFERGPTTCAGYDKALVEERTTQQEFSEQDTNQGDLPVTPDNVALIKESLDAAFGGTGSAEIVADGGCDHSGRAAVYCAGERTVVLNVAELTRIARPLDIAAERQGKASPGKGDFAAWASIASRYVLSVQQTEGLPLDGPLTGLRTACLVGSWAGAANQPRQVDKVVRLSPGDVDEAVLEMLQPNSLIASDVDGNSVPSGFLRIEAFRVGYNNGPDTCTTRYS